MKFRSAWLGLALAGTAMSQQQPPAPAPPVRSGPVEIGGIAATVNGKVITKTELAYNTMPYYARLAAQFPRRGAEFERQMEDARSKVLDAMIDQKIILTEFAELTKKGAKLPEHVVDDEIRRQVKERFNGDEAKLHEELKKANIREDTFRNMVRDDVIVQAIRSEHFSDAPPPLPAEINAKYNQIKEVFRDTNKDRITFAKIFLPTYDRDTPGSTPESQLDLADKLVTDIRNGADLGELAKKHSRDSFASEGGLQKDVSRLDLSQEFAAIVFAAKDGDLLGPLEDPQGLTIVKIIKLDKAPSPPLSQIREQVESEVRKDKTSAGYKKWIEEKRKAAMIDKRIK